MLYPVSGVWESKFDICDRTAILALYRVGALLRSEECLLDLELSTLGMCAVVCSVGDVTSDRLG